MRLKNLRHATIRVDGNRLGKGQSMSIKPNQISSKLQRLIDRGYFTVEVDSKVIEQPEAGIAETQPPPLPPEIPVVEEKVEQEVAPIVKVEEKPKITKRRRKKAAPKSEE